ncbi:hypothetical protein MPTK1_5g15440 [Marchantia polymorpha subsp. ruderalis]|uniref:Thiol-disulfide oxidoreductase DCC n=2 Tax=Marchantia polymorpha TaxID=3197 RepID=A0AAF6BIN5_MARPO|nr:hypothetical protein MARPO_0071s0065 [Marchantia polymorpha]PTQ35451.1 hypothetical protein MARPO_0071s0065 [Marchantia polymorpha]BBN11869.1 hypothetical protein Mp_5g15440 [Marchantia polymorpha subsp. ruderalis]BBN11870.1 hypothetical protein Mp_5g15440 [Marchantia polymorpha subsp. ruderalis]|eukprot:PTQ35450.1 hypothetical protein MARPO_0071s0065 [Marchantia polymorpha]
MASVSGALRPCLLPGSTLRSIPRCYAGRNKFTVGALWDQVSGRSGVVKGANWNPDLTGGAASPFANNRTERVLFYGAAEIQKELSSGSHCLKSFCTKAVGGPTSSATQAGAESRTSIEQESNLEDPDSPSTWTIKMLYDGDCPLCMREVDMLRGRNKTYGTIKFVDISSDSYSPEENSDIDFEEAMGRIHAILRDGTILTNVAAFKRLYEEVGLGWVYAVTNFEPVGKLADSVYSFWAKYRLPLTGRPPLIEVLETRRQKQAESCDIGGCRTD